MFFKATFLTAILFPIGAIAQCAATPEAVFWADVNVGQKLDDPAETLPDTGVNPATPADTSAAPFNAFARFDSSVAGNARRCTAQMVADNIAMTAAHCVRDKNGTWLDHFEFTPVAADAAQDAEAVCMATLDGWVTGDDGAFSWAHDLSLIVFDRPVTTNTLALAAPGGDVVGAAVATGFPIAIDGGSTLQVATGFAFDAQDLASPAPAEGVGTGLIVHGEWRMGTGISGGAWLSFSPADGTIGSEILGLSASRRMTSAYGPRVLACAHELLAFAERGCE